jgi:hypothetical protein
VNNLRSLMSATLLALALAAPSVRAADETPNPWKFEFHGFVTASLYDQNQAFTNGQGQGLLYSSPAPTNWAACTPIAGQVTCAGPSATGTGSPSHNGSVLSGDFRNSRFAFSIAGPKVFDGAAQPRAYLEFDFFGQNGAGAFGTEQALPRIRVGIAELKFGGTNIQVGQQNQLVVQQIPASLSHIANPMTYGAGTIGWRTPGARVTQTIGLDGGNLILALEAVKSKWSNEAVNAGTGNATTPGGIGFGEASGLPMFQAMAKVDGKAGGFGYMLYLVGVYQKINLKGFGDVYTLPAAAGGKDTFTAATGEVGGRLAFSPVSLQFNVYSGKATASMLGSMLTFGDVKDMGYWVALNGNFTKELALSLVYGADAPNKADTRKWGGNTARLGNTTVGGMLKYQDGGYALGLEYYMLKTEWSTTATASVKTDGMQGLVTAGYFF